MDLARVQQQHDGVLLQANLALSRYLQFLTLRLVLLVAVARSFMIWLVIGLPLFPVFFLSRF